MQEPLQKVLTTAVQAMYSRERDFKVGYSLANALNASVAYLLGTGDITDGDVEELVIELQGVVRLLGNHKVETS